MKTAGKPYERVAASLRGRVAAGEWRSGEIIPARRVLAAEYGVAAATLERAAGILIAEGTLSASDRRGTFVTSQPPTAGREPTDTRAMGNREEVLQATVGIIAEVIPYGSHEMRAGQWSAQILAGCEHGLSGRGQLSQRFFNLVPEMGDGIPAVQAVEQLLAEDVDALVIIRCAGLEEALPPVLAAGIPVVCAEYDPVVASVPQVYIDNVTGGVLGARHLRERGYRQLTYLRPFQSVWTEARLEGAQIGAGSDGLRVFPLETSLCVSLKAGAGDQTRAGLEAGREFLSLGFEPGTGVIAPNDAVALGFMDAARQQGLEAGPDYGLVGFDDFHREAHLTSLRPPLAQLGMEAAGLLVRLLRGEDAPARIALQHRLITRASTGGPTPQPE